MMRGVTAEAYVKQTWRAQDDEETRMGVSDDGNANKGRRANAAAATTASGNLLARPRPHTVTQHEPGQDEVRNAGTSNGVPLR